MYVVTNFLKYLKIYGRNYLFIPPYIYLVIGHLFYHLSNYLRLRSFICLLIHFLIPRAKSIIYIHGLFYKWGTPFRVIFSIKIIRYKSDKYVQSQQWRN